MKVQPHGTGFTTASGHFPESLAVRMIVSAEGWINWTDWF
jgi:hypothetical protein